jgi:hypothetical protein
VERGDWQRGLEGIVIGQGDPTGKAHLSVQQAALSLRDRGIVLAVSSKNQDEIARLPFRAHPEMALREEHFAVFQANWNDKATNIKAIAEELSMPSYSSTTIQPSAGWSGACSRKLRYRNYPKTPAYTHALWRPLVYSRPLHSLRKIRTARISIGTTLGALRSRSRQATSTPIWPHWRW